MPVITVYELKMEDSPSRTFRLLEAIKAGASEINKMSQVQIGAGARAGASTQVDSDEATTEGADTAPE